jgi:hypothetical protein
MALLAEELVEEWLNRQGYFTIRGLKIGVHEIDLLAIRPKEGRGLECRHIEVQVSMRPVSYISQVPKARQRHGMAANSAKVRTDEEIRQGVSEWIHKKFDHAEKQRMRQCLCAGHWSRELVVHVVKHPQELELLLEAGVIVHRLPDVIAAMGAKDRLVEGASGGHLLDLVGIADS